MSISGVVGTFIKIKGRVFVKFNNAEQNGQVLIICFLSKTKESLLVAF